MLMASPEDNFKGTPHTLDHIIDDRSSSFMSSSVMSNQQVPDPLSESRQGSILKNYFEHMMPAPLSSPVSDSDSIFQSR